MVKKITSAFISYTLVVLFIGFVIGFFTGGFLIAFGKELSHVKFQSVETIQAM